MMLLALQAVFNSQIFLAVVGVAQSPVSHVQRSLVLLPVVAVGVVSPVETRVVPYRVDQEVGNWGGEGEGGGREREGWRGREESALLFS